MSGLSEQSSKPELIIDEAEKDRLLQVRTLEQSIYDHPDRYQMALDAMLAEEVTRPVLSEDHRRTPEPVLLGPIDESTTANLKNYFNDRTDRFVEYDPATQQLIDDDPLISEELLALRTLQSKKIKYNGRISREENPQAVVVRDIIRYRTLSIFTGRIAARQQQAARNTRKNLPKAI